jgi:radical SAM-linked protein
MDRFADQYVSVCMPSMRVGTLTQEIMDQIKRVRKTGFTVAPEAGTDRLREVINKGISEADLMETCRNAFALGWNLIKLYFMIGLPTETWDDVEAIVDLARKAKNEAGPLSKRVQINVSVGTFVPKPHTPFQWERQLTIEESKERIDKLKKLLPRKGFKLKWHDPQQSYMEGVFSRGDRRLSFLVETAWRSGVRLDGWSEHYRLENWQQAAKECGIDLDSYLLARDPNKVLPWDHLDSGVDKEFLVQELQNAFARVYTPDCRTQGCQKCGLCDFKTIFPIVHSPGKVTSPDREKILVHDRSEQGGESTFSCRVHYTRLGSSRFYSHLEILQLVFRALTRAGVHVLYSQGFNPSPRVSFSPALPVGMESEVEYFDMDLPGPIENLDEVVTRLNKELPSGMRVIQIGTKPDKEPEALLTNYSVSLANEMTDEQKTRIEKFLSEKSFIIKRVRKKKTREVDIRPLVSSIELEGNVIYLELLSFQGKAGVNPKEILKEVVGVTDEDALLAGMKKNAIAIFSPNA